MCLIVWDAHREMYCTGFAFWQWNNYKYSKSPWWHHRYCCSNDDIIVIAAVMMMSSCTLDYALFHSCWINPCSWLYFVRGYTISLYVPQIHIMPPTCKHTKYQKVQWSSLPVEVVIPCLLYPCLRKLQWLSPVWLQCSDSWEWILHTQSPLPGQDAQVHRSNGT